MEIDDAAGRMHYASADRLIDDIQRHGPIHRAALARDDTAIAGRAIDAIGKADA